MPDDINYANREPACIAVDASGAMFKPIILCDGTQSGPLFLYLAVVRDKEGHFSVYQMITASIVQSSFLAFRVGFHFEVISEEICQ